MVLLPFLLLHRTCSILHQTRLEATINSSNNNTAEFYLINTVSSQVLSASGILYQSPWCQLSHWIFSGTVWDHSPSVSTPQGHLFTCTVFSYLHISSKFVPATKHLLHPSTTILHYGGMYSIGRRRRCHFRWELFFVLMKCQTVCVSQKNAHRPAKNQ